MGASLLSSFMSGGDKGSASSTASKSGDATSGLSLDFTSNNAFQVGGSGGSNQSATADKSAGLSSNTTMYLIIGGAAVLVVGILAWSLKRKA